YLKSAIQRQVPHLNPDKPQGHPPLYWEEFIRSKDEVNSYNFMIIGDVLRRCVFWMPALILLVSSLRNDKGWLSFNTKKWLLVDEWSYFNQLFFCLALLIFVYNLATFFYIYRSASHGVIKNMQTSSGQSSNQ